MTSLLRGTEHPLIIPHTLLNNLMRGLTVIELAHLNLRLGLRAWYLLIGQEVVVDAIDRSFWNARWREWKLHC